MKKTLLLLFVALFAFSACGEAPVEPQENEEVTMEEPAMPVASADAVVAEYLKLTLGTVPGAGVDYEAAKPMMYAPFRDLFDSPMFVPTTYCIQDGPTEVNVMAAEASGDMASVTVEAAWGGELSPHWKFTLVPVNGEWQVSQIECL
ncbi:hypothetical protein KJ632_05415 [Patescibacteria group bacterium]|nr:hypothetical protein [Patescibacteria group bacterium]